MSDQSVWLNWKQACQILGCSRSHFYNLVKSGKLPSKRSGTAKGLKVTSEDCKKWLNWQQACDVLGCSKSHFYDLINSGRLPFICFGRSRGVKVLREDCEKWLKQNTVI